MRETVREHVGMVAIPYDGGMKSLPRPAKVPSDRRLRSGLIAIAVFIALGVLGLMFGFGRSSNSAGVVGSEVCRATCEARGWRDGSLVAPEHGTTGAPYGPKGCQCR